MPRKANKGLRVTLGTSLTVFAATTMIAAYIRVFVDLARYY